MKSRKQAIAIGLCEARTAGQKVPWKAGKAKKTKKKRREPLISAASAQPFQIERLMQDLYRVHEMDEGSWE